MDLEAWDETEEWAATPENWYEPELPVAPEPVANEPEPAETPVAEAAEPPADSEAPPAEASEPPELPEEPVDEPQPPPETEEKPAPELEDLPPPPEDVPTEDGSREPFDPTLEWDAAGGEEMPEVEQLSDDEEVLNAANELVDELSRDPAGQAVEAGVEAVDSVMDQDFMEVTEARQFT